MASKKRQGTKVLIVGDLHGRVPKIRFQSDAIIAPGDFCSDKIRTYIFRAMKQQAKGKDVGWEDLAGKKASKMVEKMFGDGRKVLEHLNDDGRPVYSIPGNWERERGEYTYARMRKGLKNIKDCHLKRRELGDYSIIGYGYSSGPEDEGEYKKCAKKLRKLFERAEKPVVFLTHNMPIGVMDKVKNKQSPAYGMHLGSIVARELIEEFQPLVAIGGHMHEYFGKKKIGKTTVINAGFGPTKNTLLTLKKNKVMTRFYR